ncbi:MAG TPA: XRE family transcriptional regulator [Deltaproteobacteria bacterium]|nr:XRE family transcriptional regulator [Deltaproteobacteria bacterium]
MNSLRQLRKMKGLTMEQLAKKSGISSKTISLYELNPPGRPSQKVVQGLCRALEIAPENLMELIGSKRAQVKGSGIHGAEEEVTELLDMHVSRILALIDKEVLELQHLMTECASFADDHPAMMRNMDYIAADIDLLVDIKARLS